MVAKHLSRIFMSAKLEWSSFCCRADVHFPIARNWTVGKKIDCIVIGFWLFIVDYLLVLQSGSH